MPSRRPGFKSWRCQPRKSSQNLQNLRKSRFRRRIGLLDLASVPILVRSVPILVLPYRFWYAPYRYRYAVRRVVCSFLLSGILASYLGPLLCLFGPRWGLEPWSRRSKFSSLTMRAYLRLLRRVLCIGCRALGVPILARANIGTLGSAWYLGVLTGVMCAPWPSGLALGSSF